MGTTFTEICERFVGVIILVAIIFTIADVVNNPNSTAFAILFPKQSMALSLQKIANK